jgi:DMSO/TMAO reductase YedYZ heme-binding membrane subunit
MIISIILLILLIILALTAMRPGFESREGSESPQYHKLISRYSAPHH